MAKKKRRKFDESSKFASISSTNSKKTSAQEQAVIFSTKSATRVAEETSKALQIHLKSAPKIRLILLVFSTLIYLNSLKCGFVYDDRRAILENRNVVQPGNWLQLFTDDFWGTPVSHRGSHKSYRPLVTITYKLQGQLGRSLTEWFSGDSSERVQITKLQVLASPEFAGSDALKHNTSPEVHSETSDNAQPEAAAPSEQSRWDNTLSWDAFGYHFVNLLLHLCVCDLVFELSGRLLIDKRNQVEYNDKVSCSKLPLEPSSSSLLQSQSPETAKVRDRNGRRKRAATKVTVAPDVCFQAIIEHKSNSTSNKNDHCDRSQMKPAASFDANNSNNNNNENVTANLNVNENYVHVNAKTITFNRHPNYEHVSTKRIIAAFLFACHPIHVESVASLVGRAELMGTLFGLLSFRSMIKRLESNATAVSRIGTIHEASGKPQRSRQLREVYHDEECNVLKRVCIKLGQALAGGFNKPSYLFRAICFALFACLSKENSSTVILINIVLVIWSRMTNRTCKLDLRAICAMLVVLISFGCIRLAVLLDMNDASNPFSGMSMPMFSQYDNPLAMNAQDFCKSQRSLLGIDDNDYLKTCSQPQTLAQVRYQMLLTRLYLPVFNLKLLLNPSSLSYDWPLATIGYVKSVFEARFLAAIGLYAMLIWSMTPFMCLCSSSAFNIVASRLKRYRHDDWSDISRDYLHCEEIVGVASSECDSGRNVASIEHRRKGDNRTPDSGYCDSLSEADKNLEASEASDEQETGSVSSMDTSKSNDSGFTEICARKAEEQKSSTNETIDKQNGIPEETSYDIDPVPSAEELFGGRLLSSGECYQPRKQTTSGSSSPEQGDVVRQARGETQLLQELPAQDENRSVNNGAKDDLIVWPLIWLTLPYLPASNLLVSVGFLAAERTLYLPSFGFCLLAAHLIEIVAQKIAMQTLGNKRFYHLLLQQWISSTKRFGGGGSDHPSGCQQKPQRKTSIAAAKRPDLKTAFKSTAQNCSFSTSDPTRLSSDETRKQVSDRKSAIQLALIMPLIILGSLKTIQRNADWLNDFTLYNSNLLQSPAKSMANLASIGLSEQAASLDAKVAIGLYRKALEIEPNSADLHYNLALTMHRKREQMQLIGAADDVTMKGRATGKSNLDSAIEYHYKRAIELRANFPMAALSLGAYQWKYLSLFEEAEQSFVDCFQKMDARSSKTYLMFVQTQFECLISASKLHTTHKSTKKAAAIDLERPKQTNANANFNDVDVDVYLKAGRTNNNKRQQQKQSIDSCPLRVLDWMRSMKAKFASSHQIDLLARETSDLESRRMFGDLSKQFATIGWLESKCMQENEILEEKQRLGVLSEAVERFAWSSSSWIEPGVYMDYIEALMAVASVGKVSSDAVEKGVKVWEHAFEIELAKWIKLVGIASKERNSKAKTEKLAEVEIVWDNLSRLVRFLARILNEKEAKQIGQKLQRRMALDKAKKLMNTSVELGFDQTKANTMVAEIAFELGDFKSSELHYELALRSAIVEVENKACSSPEVKEQLAKAHVNLGAILQLNGKVSEARKEYKLALECDQNNRIAKQNLASIGERDESYMYR